MRRSRSARSGNEGNNGLALHPFSGTLLGYPERVLFDPLVPRNSFFKFLETKSELTGAERKVSQGVVVWAGVQGGAAWVRYLGKTQYRTIPQGKGITEVKRSSLSRLGVTDQSLLPSMTRFPVAGN